MSYASVLAGSLLAAMLSVSPSLALADRVMLGNFEEHTYARIKRAQPDWTDEKIRAVMSDSLPTRAELLDGIPSAAVRDKDGQLEIVGRIRQIIPGLRQGNPADPIQHDKLVIETGLDGNGEIIELSVFNVIHTISSIDSAEDFEWLFSNRHTLAGVQPGSPAHRQIFYTLVDADGWLGLAEEPRLLESEDLAEGAYSTFLLKGQPRAETAMENYKWARAEQFTLPAVPPGQFTVEYGPDTLGTFEHWLDNLLWTAARARKYPGYPEHFDRWALDSLDMLCGLRFADPALVDGAAVQLAWRARALGHSCFEKVAAALSGHLHTYANNHDPDRPVSEDEIAAVALELIGQSKAIEEVILNLPIAIDVHVPMDIPAIEPIMLPGFDAPAPAPPTLAPPWADMTPIASEELQPDFDSLQYVRSLVGYMTDVAHPDALRQQARSILRHWIHSDDPVLGHNSRYWREMLWTQAVSNASGERKAAQLSVLELLCEEGWMPAADLERRVERARGVALDRALDDQAGAEALLVWVSVVRQTARNGPVWGRDLVRLITDAFPEPRFTPSEKEKKFHTMWEAIGSKPMSCNSLQPTALL